MSGDFSVRGKVELELGQENATEKQSAKEFVLNTGVIICTKFIVHFFVWSV